ncbi:hypothetical protein NDA12_004847 [Ustilago hordei]|nr:hypothetical protein NDA12_004847 [Ustilago hordei]
MSDSDRLTPPLEALYWSQYGTWYPIFRKHAPKSTVIDIDGVQPELLSWLDSDTFVLPDGSGPSTLPQTNDSSSELSDDENEKEEQEPVMLDKLDTKIRQVTQHYSSQQAPPPPRNPNHHRKERFDRNSSSKSGLPLPDPTSFAVLSAPLTS